jgi:nucleoside phosphorylase/CheY-like chemotaxis protein
MIKILIVEDNREKLQKLSQSLSDIQDAADVISVMDAHNARLQLRNTAFDLLILDVAIPTRIDRDVERVGGLELLEELFDRDIYKIPTHIIGVTAYSDILKEVSGRFSSKALTLLYFDPGSDEWKHALRARVRHIIGSKESTDAVQYGCYLAVVCALETPELASVLQLDWNWEQITVPNDFSIYYKGNVTRRPEVQSSRETVYAAAATRMGMPAAALIASKLITIFRPRYLAMTGITAGVPGKTRLGDVIAADPSWDWGSGKWIMQGKELAFMPAPHQLGIDPEIRSKLKLMRNDHAALSRIRNSWPADLPENELKLHIGPLASGASVLADGSIAQMIRDQHRELVGIEMETYGVFAAAEECATPRPRVFSLKSVVDFADSAKNDRFTKYAAYTSAKTMCHFVENYL